MIEDDFGMALSFKLFERLFFYKRGVFSIVDGEAKDAARLEPRNRARLFQRREDAS